tara:strand:+ start:2122 stop:3042 length:921 start_codon:yes stop_codon:yes gene_type:complete
MRALITGGCGFIGSNLTIACSKLGWKIDVADWDDARLTEWVEEATHAHFIISDYSDEAILDRVRDGAYDVILHLAAVPRVSYSVEHPSLTTDENVGKMVRLLEAASGNCRRFVFSSSSSVYGGAEQLPTPETAPTNPQSPYALQKLVGEQYLRMFNKLYDLDCVSLRYFNVFGPRQYGDNAYATVISAWLQAVRDGTPLRLDGTGEQSRDFCFVDNVVEANILAATSDKTFSGEAFNIGCNNRISLNDILETVKGLRDVEVNYAPPRAGDVDHSQADISRAKEVLGYTGKVGFQEGFERTLEWWGL